MNRRQFLTTAGMAAICASPRVLHRFSGSPPRSDENASPPSFETDDPQYRATYTCALAVLQRNTITLSTYPGPVLIEGSTYGGIWQECAPQEGLVYSLFRPDVARNNHLSFFKQQREDGQLPCWLRKDSVGFGQIQMVVPIAATAWELAERTGDNELLETAYRSCSQWDAWLRCYRDTRHTGLCEGFCSTTPGTITAHAGRDSQTAVPMQTRAGARHSLPFRGSVPISRPPSMVDASRSHAWLVFLEDPRKPIAGSQMLRPFSQQS